MRILYNQNNKIASQEQ